MKTNTSDLTTKNNINISTSNSWSTYLFVTIATLSLANLCTSLYQTTRSPKGPHTIKYINSEKIMSPIRSQAIKTINEMLKPRLNEINALSNQIKELEQQSKIKKYTDSQSKKQIEEKTKLLERLINKYNKKFNEEGKRILESKYAKIDEVKDKIAKEQNCSVHPIQANGSIQPTIHPDYDVTNLVLSQLGILPQQKK